MTPSDGEPSDESRIEAIRIAFSKVAHGALAAHLKGFTSGVLASDLIIIVCLAPCGGGAERRTLFPRAPLLERRHYHPERCKRSTGQ